MLCEMLQHRHVRMEAGGGVHTCRDRGELCRLLQYTNVRAGPCCDTECKGRAKLCKICYHQMCGGRGMLFGILQQDM